MKQEYFLPSSLLRETHIHTHTHKWKAVYETGVLFILESELLRLHTHTAMLAGSLPVVSGKRLAASH